MKKRVKFFRFTGIALTALTRLLFLTGTSFAGLCILASGGIAHGQVKTTHNGGITFEVRGKTNEVRGKTKPKGAAKAPIPSQSPCEGDNYLTTTFNDNTCMGGKMVAISWIPDYNYTITRIEIFTGESIGPIALAIWNNNNLGKPGINLGNTPYFNIDLPNDWQGWNLNTPVPVIANTQYWVVFDPTGSTTQPEQSPTQNCAVGQYYWSSITGDVTGNATWSGMTPTDPYSFPSDGFKFRMFCCATPPSGMDAWWPLDETSGGIVIHDIAGVFDNGTPQPSQISSGGPWSIPAVVGNGLRFPAGISPTQGPNIYVEVPSSSEVNFGTSDFTIDAWIKLGPTAGNIYPIVDKIGFNSGYALFVQGGQLLIRLGPDNYGGLVAAVSNFATPGIVLGQWYHVAVTVKRGGSKPQVTFYLNGVPNGPVSTAGPDMNAVNNINTTTPLWIGGNSRLASGGATVNRGEIVIDELEFFHTVLYQSNIMSIFNAGSAGKCK